MELYYNIRYQENYVMGFLSSIFCSENTRNVRKLEKIAALIEAKEEEFSKKTDLELMKMTKTLKERLKNGETLKDVYADYADKLTKGSFTNI